MDITHAVSSTEPADELDPDEPRTPGWMPMLGLALFVVGAIGFAKFGPTRQTFPKAEAEAVAGAAPPASAEAPATPPNPAMQGMQPGMQGMPGMQPGMQGMQPGMPPQKGG